MAEPRNKKTFYLGTGRRKTSVARVRMFEGPGEVIINGRKLEDFFSEAKDRMAVMGPLEITSMYGRVHANILVHGGGITGQAGAICQGMARALKRMYNLSSEGQAAPAEAAAPVEGETGNQPVLTMGDRLRESGFLTRDSRMKERKKYGHKGARKSFQFSKR
ncbi:MAG: 30S ribosomal protein S9 [Planctomycetes bacterium]|nr:30S ribosomal protein S9 [Planctomycetota bacterium]NBU74971.1 30S ribosomal protein S9 [Planctomycetota bacterium]